MSMIDRRDILIGGAVLGLLPMAGRAALPIPAGNRLGFDVLRKGSKLGTHILTFDRTGDGLVVHVEVDIAYKIGPITLYHYTHRATETWAGDQVVAVQTSTDDDGTKYDVSGRREASGFVVQGTKASRYVAPANALPATHWNRRELDGPWINTQDGRLMRPRIVTQGIDAIPTAGGESVKARHFNLSGDVQLDMWYEDGRGWAGLSFTKGGAEVRYERQA
jgi:hypothetical protein